MVRRRHRPRQRSVGCHSVESGVALVAFPSEQVAGFRPCGRPLAGWWCASTVDLLFDNMCLIHAHTVGSGLVDVPLVLCQHSGADVEWDVQQTAHPPLQSAGGLLMLRPHGLQRTPRRLTRLPHDAPKTHHRHIRRPKIVGSNAQMDGRCARAMCARPSTDPSVVQSAVVLCTSDITTSISRARRLYTGGK